MKLPSLDQTLVDCLMPHLGSPKMSVVEPLTGNLSHDALGVPGMTKRLRLVEVLSG